MKKSVMLSMGLLFAIASQSSYAGDGKPLLVENLITPNALSCEFKFDSSGNETIELILDYFTFANKTPLSNFDKAKKILTLSNGVKLKGVKRFSKTTEKTDITIIDRAHIDIDVKKYGVHVLRISDYRVEGLEMSEYDADGYYLILKGLPKSNIIKLEKQGVYIADKFTKIKKTKGGNTRIICNIAG
ncbi:MAG: hypothetical protein CR966_01360 [Pseudomonadales bacterium]|nr:MAG: hypothetical protein CR966_01360 [Pseudomonadales bacterium]